MRPTLTFRLLITAALLLPAGGTLLRPGRAASPTSIEADASGGDSLLPVLPSPQPAYQTDEDVFDALILFAADAAAPAALEEMDAAPYAVFGRGAAYAFLDAQQAAAVRSLPGVSLVALPADSPVDASLAGDDVNTRGAILAWNARHDPAAALDLDALDPPPEPLINDRLIPPDDPYLNPVDLDRKGNSGEVPSKDEGSAEAPAAMDAAPGASRTSDFMAGKIAVDIFLPESTGGAENWTPTMVDNITSQINSGLTWWAATQTQGGRPSAGITFVINYHTPFNENVSVNFEPIQFGATRESDFVSQVLSPRGFTGDYMSAARSYANARRQEQSADWAFTIWIINSEADGDGKFSDGLFGYAYVNGPFLVMTYDNDGWGISRMQIVTAHETGHIFGADDEYYGSPCEIGQEWGYLSVANTNCENSSGSAPEHSIMRGFTSQTVYAYPGHLASTSARGQVGLRDLDGDGIYDPLDTLSINLTALNPDPTTDSTPTFSGSAQDTPFDAPLLPDSSINSVTGVQMRLDGGAWFSCAASDGAWGESGEDFACTSPALLSGAHTAEARAVGRYGSYSALAADAFTISPAGPPGAFAKTTPAPGAVNQPLNLQLAWGASTNAVSYEYCVDLVHDLDCDLPAAWTTVTGGATSVSPSGLSHATAYSWQVRAVNSDGTVEASDGWRTFTTVPAPPGTFVKTAPTNTASDQPTGLTLTWSAAADASDYQVCLDQTADGECGAAWTSTGGTTALALAGLNAGALYSWQVRASGAGGETLADGGQWFTFYTASPPGDFTKLTPFNGIGSLPATSTLTWEVLAGAVEYRYCLDTVSDGGCSGSMHSAGLSLQADPVLAHGVTYEWQVFAVMAGGSLTAANGGSVWTFTVEGVPQILLPLVFATNFANGINDGGFEAGRGVHWSESSAQGFPLVMESADLPEGLDPHGGEWAAWLGGDDDETSRLWQTVTVPNTSTPRLSFWYWIASNDACGFDEARVRLGSATLANIDLCADANTGGWSKATIGVAAYAGRSLTLEFIVTTDGGTLSNFYLDDVEFTD